jgi:acetoin:2,6-dichlorophenolindophenol oxidoreductase subunit beta
MSITNKQTYSYSIFEAFDYLLETYPEVFIMGQGLWSPWYVGSTMKDLEKKYGKNRVIDTPVSESACTGAGVGASLCGMRPIIVHPRMDFMLYAIDAIVNQAAKWSLMTGGQSNPGVTIRSIINRGGEQGAQHSQALHSWFAHIPGLRVVMPSTVQDARDLLIASVLSPDPVIYIDDRWLYELEDEVASIEQAEIDIKRIQPKILTAGDDITIIGCGYSTKLSLDACNLLKSQGVTAEIIDLRVLNPFKSDIIVESVEKTGRLLVVDGGWKPCGISAEILASVYEKLALDKLKSLPKRITLPFAAAPTASVLEDIYYTKVVDIVKKAVEMVNS